MLPRITYASIVGAIVSLNNPLSFSQAQADANRLIKRVHAVVCGRCDETGHVPGIRKPRKCRRCAGAKFGYRFGQAIYWTGWAPQTKAQYLRVGEIEC